MNPSGSGKTATSGTTRRIGRSIPIVVISLILG